MSYFIYLSIYLFIHSFDNLKFVITDKISTSTARTKRTAIFLINAKLRKQLSKLYSPIRTLQSLHAYLKYVMSSFKFMRTVALLTHFSYQYDNK